MTQPRMFVTPIARVGLADSHKRRYDIQSGYEPFFIYDRMGQLGKEKKLISSEFPAYSLAQFGNHAVPHCCTVNRKWLKGTFLRPIYRQPIPWERADGSPTRRWGIVEVPEREGWGDHSIHDVINDFWDYYTFYPTSAENWDFTLAEDGLLWEFTQKVSYTGDGTSKDDWVTSMVGFAGTANPDTGESIGLCPNPFFTAGFRRAGIPPEFATAVAAILAKDESGHKIKPEDLGFGWTEIVWGACAWEWPQGKWMLYCPLTGAPRLYEMVLGYYPWQDHGVEDLNQHWEYREWTEGKLSELKPKKAADEGYTYHIATIGACICVSESDFEGNDFAYYRVEDMSEPVVPSGEMFMRNCPGQCSFWLDLNVFAVGQIDRWPVYVPAFRPANQGNYVHGSPFSLVMQEETALPEDAVVANTLEGVDGLAAYILPLGLYQDLSVDSLMHYSLIMHPGTFPAGVDPTAEVVTQTSPFVEAVSVFQNPELTDNGAPTFTETPQAVSALISDQDLEDKNVAKHELVVDNRLALFTPPEGTPPAEGLSPTHDFRPGRQVRILHAGWKMVGLDDQQLFDVTIPMGDYWIVSPSRKSKEARFVVTDLLGMLALECWEGETEINFRGWTQRDAIAFGLEYQGIGPDQYDLEDAGLTLIDSDKWGFKRGTSWLKIYRTLVGHWVTIWYDWTDGKIKTGCRFCRQKRTNETVLAHADNGWASSACLAADLVRVPDTGVDLVAVEDLGQATSHNTEYLIPEGALEIEEATLDGKEYANSIVGVGKQLRADEGFGEIQVRWRNHSALDPAAADASDDYVGYVISRVEDNDKWVTLQETEIGVVELVTRNACRPMKAGFPVPLATWLKPGMVTQLEGGKWAGVHGMKFRVTGVRHDPKTAMTQVRGRQMLGLPDDD